MNKAQLIKAVAEELGGSKAAANRAINAVVCSIARGIQQDNAVSIGGFGKFSRKERPARQPVCRPRAARGDEPLSLSAARTSSGIRCRRRPLRSGRGTSKEGTSSSRMKLRKCGCFERNHACSRHRSWAWRSPSCSPFSGWRKGAAPVPSQL